MKKKNRGFMLAETLLVTAFVAGLLVYLYIQFMNLSSSYDDAYDYNTVEDLYALSDIVDYIYSDERAYEYIKNNVINEKYIDITNCTLFTDTSNCEKLFGYEKVTEVFITTNVVPKSDITNYSTSFMKFIKKINSSGLEPYRIIASFENKTYATLRFGGYDE